MSTDIGLGSATVVVGIATIAAALISKSIKIAEFRQAWIDALRADIARYISVSDKWLDCYIELMSLPTEERPDRKSELEVPKYDAIRLLRRIELRLNLKEQPHDFLLKKLNCLLDPSSMPPKNGENEPSRSAWQRHCDDAVQVARTILKHEWEVTKHPWLSKTYRFFDFLLGTSFAKKLDY